VPKLREMVAILREMGCRAKGDGWPYSGRWVAKLREVGGHTHEDGRQSSGRRVAKLREGMPSSSRCVKRLRWLGIQAQGDGYLHNACILFDHSDCTEHDKWQCRLSFTASPSTFSKCSIGHAINLMEIYVLRFNCSVYIRHLSCLSSLHELISTKKSLHTETECVNV
jgi:hypothetical protein